MRRKIVSLAGSAAMIGMVAGPLAPAQAADHVYVSGPGGQITGWTQPVIVTRAGDKVTYVNADIAPHDVVALDRKGPDEPWCAQAGFTPGNCPLVYTVQIGLGGTADVLGTNNLKPGDQFTFYCRVHPSMEGTWVVAPA